VLPLHHPRSVPTIAVGLCRIGPIGRPPTGPVPCSFAMGSLIKKRRKRMRKKKHKKLLKKTRWQRRQQGK
jgi:Mitochondrial mRNA-processing protein COX24, C-terminal